jgi:outer membrane protein assembly factor BamD
MRFRVYITLIFLLLLSSCGEYGKLLKSNDYDLKKTKVKEYYDEGKYARATELLEQLLPRYRATEEAEDLNWMNAQSYFNMKDYYSAGAYFKTYLDQYPFGKYAEESSYMSALCDYYLSPRPELDQENTRNAIEGFNLFLTKYTYSARIDECKKLMKELEEKLVEKSYLSAKLYYDMKQYKAAITALNNSLKEYTDSEYREEMMFLKLNSLFLYAENSLASKQRERYQDTLDDYYSFMEEFPESKYIKDVGRIYKKTSEYLKAGSIDIETVANND